jgi:hypothetical protein
MALGAVGVIGRLGAKAAIGTVKLGGKAAKATGKAALTSAKASPGAVGRAAVNIPANIGKTFWNAHVQDLGLTSLTMRSGPLLKPKVELDEDGKPKVKRKRKAKPDKPKVEPKDGSGLGSRAAAQIVAALKPLASIEMTLDGMDGSLAGMRQDIQGLSRANSQGFNNVINTLKALLPNAFDNLRNQRGKHDGPSGGGVGDAKQRKSLLDSMGGLPNLLNKIFGTAGLVATALGALSKMGLGIGRGASAVGRGVARTGRGISNAARETIRGRSNSARATARGIGAGEAIPEVVRPVEAPRATETLRSGEPAERIRANETARVNETPRASETARPGEAPKPVETVRATETARPVEAPRAAETVRAGEVAKSVTPETARPVDVNRPLHDAPRPGDVATVPPAEAKPVQAPKPTPTLKPDADGKIHDSNRINFDEPDGRVAPKPSAAEPPKPNLAEVLKATEVPTVNAGEVITGGVPETPTIKPGEATPEVKAGETIKPVDPEAPKPTLKPDTEVKAGEAKTKPKTNIRGTSALSKALGRAFIGGAVVLETIQGYDEWSDAYDKYLAGEITPKEYRKKTVEIVGKAAGSFTGGLALGAIAGGVTGLAAGPGAPVASTIAGLIGGAAGGVVGAFHGAALGEKAGSFVADKLIGPIDDEDKKLTLTPRPGATPVSPALPEAPTLGVPTRPRPEANTDVTPEQMVEHMKNHESTSVTPEQIVDYMKTNGPQTAAATQMIAQSNQVAAQNRTPQAPVIIAPTNNTTNNTGGGNSGGGGGGRPQVGNPRADLSELDRANLGSRIGNAPGVSF